MTKDSLENRPGGWSASRRSLSSPLPRWCWARSRQALGISVAGVDGQGDEAKALRRMLQRLTGLSCASTDRMAQPAHTRQSPWDLDRTTERAHRSAYVGSSGERDPPLPR